MSNYSAMDQFILAIQQIIADSGLSLRDAAVEIGMAPGNLSKILNGKERVTFDRAERIANRLGATLSVDVKKMKEKVTT